MPKWTDKVQQEDFDRMVKRALTAVGVHLLGAAMLNADESRKTGRLKGSLTYAVKGEQSRLNPDENGVTWSEDKIDKPNDKYTCFIPMTFFVILRNSRCCFLQQLGAIPSQ